MNAVVSFLTGYAFILVLIFFRVEGEWSQISLATGIVMSIASFVIASVSTLFCGWAFSPSNHKWKRCVKWAIIIAHLGVISLCIRYYMRDTGYSYNDTHIQLFSTSLGGAIALGFIMGILSEATRRDKLDELRSLEQWRTGTES